MNPKRTIKTVAKVMLHDFGAIHGVRQIYGNGIRILMYHRFTGETENLKRQCELLRRYYSPVSLRSISEYLQSGKSLPRNAVAITVDDGYRDFLLHGYPVFQEYGLPTTVFLVSDFIDGKQWQWWDTIRYTLSHTKRTILSVELDGREAFTGSLTTNEEREVVRRSLTERLKLMENSERLEVCQKLPELLGVELPEAPPEEFAPLTWNEIRDLASRGVEFGAHTKTHPILSRIRDRKQLHEEIEGSKRRLDKELGSPTIHFCYPNGRRLDFNEATINFVEGCGFLTAVTTERGMNYGRRNPFLLRRLAVDSSDPSQYFHELVAGVRKH